MPDAIRDIKKRRGRPPTGVGTPVLVRLQPDLLAQLDGYIENDRPGMSRPEAIRLIVQMYLFLHEERKLGEESE